MTIALQYDIVSTSGIILARANLLSFGGSHELASFPASEAGSEEAPLGLVIGLRTVGALHVGVALFF